MHQIRVHAEYNKEFAYPTSNNDIRITIPIKIELIRMRIQQIKGTIRHYAEESYRVFINDVGKLWGSYMDQKAACELEMVSSFPNF